MKKSDLPLEFDCQNLPQSDAQISYCDHCQEDVTDISQFSRRGAKAFLKANPDACIRFTVDEKENLVFAPSSRLSRQVRGAQRLVSVAAIVPLLTLVACEDSGEIRAESHGVQIAQNANGAAVLMLESCPDDFETPSLPTKTRPTKSYEADSPEDADGYKAFIKKIDPVLIRKTTSYAGRRFHDPKREAERKALIESEKENKWAL